MDYPVKKVFDGKFIRVFDLEICPGGHYYDVTRRDTGDLVIEKTKEEISVMNPDAVSMAVILSYPDGNRRLLLTKEYRYPCGQYLLSVPAGLIDPEDRKLPGAEALSKTAIRELFEETGLTFSAGDEISVVNPCLFSSPGMTDESNALVKLVLHHENYDDIGFGNIEGTEKISGAILLSKEEAKEILKKGRDPEGVFYSVYTWMALAAFLFDL